MGYTFFSVLVQFTVVESCVIAFFRCLVKSVQCFKFTIFALLAVLVLEFTLSIYNGQHYFRLDSTLY